MAMILAGGRAPSVSRRDERWRSSDESASFGKKMPRGKYQTGLASFPGDKSAIVQSKGEAEAVAKAKGITILQEPMNARTGIQYQPEPDLDNFWTD